MLVRILPDAVSRSWELLKGVLRKGVMPLAKLDDKGMNVVLENLLSGKLTCWYGYDEGKVHTVVITEILYEKASQTKNLMIFAVSIIEKVQPDEYVEMLETLRKYAKGLKCEYVYCYASNEKLIKLFEAYGADTSYRLVRYEF